MGGRGGVGFRVIGLREIYLVSPSFSTSDLFALSLDQQRATYNIYSPRHCYQDGAISLYESGSI